MSTPEIRRSQAIFTFGPGALIDLPQDSALIGGLEHWSYQEVGEERIHEPRLEAKICRLKDLSQVQLRLPPRDDSPPWEQAQAGITAWRFPDWCLTPEEVVEIQGEDAPRQRLVRRRQLDPGRGLRYERKSVIPVRFVAACNHGHLMEFPWLYFIHRGEVPEDCKTKPLYLSQTGTGGDLLSLSAQCSCGASRTMSEAMELNDLPLGTCFGSQPWLGVHVSNTECPRPKRLLIRSASNAYFPQVYRVLSLPEVRSERDQIIERFWDRYFRVVDDLSQVKTFRVLPDLTSVLENYSDEEILEGIQSYRGGGGDVQRSVKEVELEAILQAKEGASDETIEDADFHVERLPRSLWSTSGLDHVCDGIESVLALHRLREVSALTGFTRFEGISVDLTGEFDQENEVQVAPISQDPTWFPAVENRGEGVFLQLKSEKVKEWLALDAVNERVGQLQQGYLRWAEERDLADPPPYHGGAYVLLHTLSHLLIQALAVHCGYPATSIRERIYCLGDTFGLLLYTASPDADGTLGGLVQQARKLPVHLDRALRGALLCSSDPVCSSHNPNNEYGDKRYLHGAACHGCAYIAETSCENRNEYLDRCLVVPTLDQPEAAYFRDVPR